MRNGLRFGEVVIAGDATNGIIYDRYDDSCEARLDGEVIWTHPLAVVCARALARQGVHLSWSFISDKPATIAAAPQEAQAAADAAHAVAAAFGFPPYLTNAARDAAEHAHQVAAAFERHFLARHKARRDALAKRLLAQATLRRRLRQGQPFVGRGVAHRLAKPKATRAGKSNKPF